MARASEERQGVTTARVVAGLCVFLQLTILASNADARRHYWRRSSYSPPASAMAVDFYTGRILYSKNANEPRFPASITKVMTLYLLFDALRDGRITMNTPLRVSAHAAAQSPSKLELEPGDTITVANAIGAIVTKSANDVAVVVAEALAGSEEEFARRMTQKARTIGMLNTTFKNASGLPNPEQHTTAQDLIVMARSILTEHPERSKVFSTRYFEYHGDVYRNHNSLLFTYEGMEGMKTGFTTASGFNLIATAHRGDKRLIAVVLGGESSGARNAAMRRILDASWSKAMTEVAARKAGMLVAQLKPKGPAIQETAKVAEVKQSRQENAKPAEQAPPVKVAEVRPSQISPVRTKPDEFSRALIFAAVERSLIDNALRKNKSAEPASSSPELATDEPEEGSEKLKGREAHLAVRIERAAKSFENQTAIARTAAEKRSANVSYHYKTSFGHKEEATLAPVAIDDSASREVVAALPVETPRSAAFQPAQRPQAQPANLPQTLAAATMQQSLNMDQPGPYHVQVGAFEQQALAEQRLESVKDALGAAMVKAHPVFIMSVNLPSKTMYRARLGKFESEAQAKAACRTLKKNGIECWDIRAQ